ncbi:uncharacterized protein LOC111832039 [Capsella rubella]|uniref:uncharacterized protein LOC111832039 n=1 Tax=Capsella rubella TaxID=81985 RepID=UPI000CD5518F|nr:uncharacterized protein LOC111832039 [Capsella rubella]
MSGVMKVKMHYGGYGSVKEDLFNYIGGLVKEDMTMDPDYATWSLFDEFCEENGMSGVVEKVWYKLRDEEIGLARLIYDDKDAQIRQMCREAMTKTGDIDIYIHQMGCGEHHESDGEEPVETGAEDKGVEDKGEDPVEEVGNDDPRFEALYNEIHTSQRDETEGQCAVDGGERNVNEGEAAVDEEELERQCVDDEHPNPALDTDDEWEEFNRDPDDYVDKHFLTSWWQDNYSENIKPVRGERMWKAQDKGPIEVPEKRKQRGRPKKYARIKEAHESSTNPNKVTRDGRTMTCSNCKGAGHNKSTCNKPVAPSYLPRKRGRPRKTPIDNHDPWSIQNAPRRLRTVQSQTIPSVPLSQSTPIDPSPSTAPPTNTEASTTGKKRRGRPPGSRGRGRGKGLGRGSDAPKPPIFFMSPWTNTVFDAWRPQDP